MAATPRLVRKIRWYSWGVAHAVGSGITDYVGPHQGVLQGTQERGKIVLFQLGRCNGRGSYDAIDWFFPQHHQHFRPGTCINSRTKGIPMSRAIPSARKLN